MEYLPGIDILRGSEMANIIERVFDLLKLSYDEDYDVDEDDEVYETPVKKETKKAKNADKVEKEEKTDSFRKNNTAKTAQTRGNSRTQKNDQPQAEGFFGGSKTGKPVGRSASNVSVIRGGNNMESEIVSIRPKDDTARVEIGKRLMEGKTVLINMEGLELDVAQRIVDFTFGVCFAIKGNMKFPSKYIVIAVPDEVGLSGEFENSDDSSSRRTTTGSKTQFEY